MTSKEEQEQRDFVHTVEVLLASALAERELARSARGLSGPPVRRTSAPFGQLATYRRWPAVAAAVLALLGATYGGYEYSRWQPAHPVETQRIAAVTAAKNKADDERARQEAEVMRLAEAAVAEKRADEQRARQEAEAKRLAAVVTEKRADEERAHQEVEARRLAAAEAPRTEEARVAAVEVPAEEAARRQAEERAASTVLNAEERAMFVKRIQEVLKHSQCYGGAINGSSEDAQKSLDRFVESVRLQGKDKPARIELAKATAGDFDAWLKQADDIKGGLCSPPLEKVEKRPIAAKPQHREEPKRAQAPERARSSSGSGGGASGVIEGVK